MSPRNGDKSKFNRERKQQITRRKRTHCGQPRHPIKGKVEIPRTETPEMKDHASRSLNRKVARCFDASSRLSTDSISRLGS